MKVIKTKSDLIAAVVEQRQQFVNRILRIPPFNEQSDVTQAQMALDKTDILIRDLSKDLPA
jgi:hypothetical protein